ncbi:MAG: hypothetical protein ACK5M1_09305 [Xanthomarina gelatinilytica]|uniref:hypothetical protein n=1 Tax=Xanthomarina gelatinilytica TaxID=1137281 RepID=UPI003A881D89
MKNTLIILLILPLFAISQNKKVHQEKSNVEFLIDSTKVDMDKIYLSNSNIKNVNVVKEGNGKVFIELKENVTLETLSEIDYKSINLIDNKVFIIDNKLIKKPSEIKIDTTDIGDLEIIKSSEFENQKSSFSIIRIITKSEPKRIENAKKGKIMIKGTELTLNVLRKQKNVNTF